MCKSVCIRDSAHNIDTPGISELKKLNFKIAIICIFLLYTYT